MFIAVVHFGLMYLLVGALFRLFCLKFPDNPVAQAIAFAQ